MNIPQKNYRPHAFLISALLVLCALTFIFSIPSCDRVSEKHICDDKNTMPNPCRSSLTMAYVMFDLGLGEVYWQPVHLAQNSTALDATETAARSLGLEVEIINYSFGNFVNSIGGKTSEDLSWWWHFLVWNATARTWEDAQVGPSSYVLSQNDVIGWAQVSKPCVSPDSPTAWSSFRSRGGNSTSPLPKTPEIRYSIDIGRGPIDTTPAYSNGKLYVLSGGKLNWSMMDYDRKGAITCIDAEAGKVLWEREVASSYGYQLSSPCIYDEKIFFGSTAGGFYCYGTNGTLLWSVSCGPVTSSPVCYMNRVLFSSDGELLCYSTTGAKYWNVTVGEVYSSSPSIHNWAVYIGTEDSMLYCINLTDGAELWSAELRGKIRSTPCIYEDNGAAKIFFTSCIYQGFTGIDGELYCYSSEGEQLWNRTIGPSVSSPVARQGLVFFGTSNGLACYTLSGEKRFELEVGEVKSAPSISSESAVVFSTNVANGTVYAVDRNGNLLGNRTLAPAQFLLSSPILCNGEAFQCSDNGLVYCFGDLAPVANFTYIEEKSGKYIFDGSTSKDETGIVKYSWNFDDGDHATGMIAEHEYVEEGVYNVTLTITDDEGSESACRRMVIVVLEKSNNTSEDRQFTNDEITIVWTFGIFAIMGVLTSFWLRDEYRRKP